MAISYNNRELAPMWGAGLRFALAAMIFGTMTSAPRSAPERPRYLVPVKARESGLSRDGFVKCDQLLTFPTMILGGRAGRLNPEAIDRVDDALRFVLGL